MNEFSLPPGAISTEGGAKLIMVSVRHFFRLVHDGWIKKSPDGHYLIVAVVQGYIAALKDEVRRGSALSAKNRVGDARAREIELRIAQQERSLLPIESCLEFADVICGAFRSELSSMPAALTRDRELRAKIQVHCDSILFRVATLGAEHSSALRSGVPIADAVEEDDVGSVGSG